MYLDIVGCKMFKFWPQVNSIIFERYKFGNGHNRSILAWKRNNDIIIFDADTASIRVPAFQSKLPVQSFYRLFSMWEHLDHGLARILLIVWHPANRRFY